MLKEELENIITQQSDLKNIPNSELIKSMDLLTTDFEATKQNIISLTYYLDTVEELYNSILKEYQSRGK
jgi:predicted RND superfamily exporter protein